MPLWDQIDAEIADLQAFHSRRQAADMAVDRFNRDQAMMATQIHNFYKWLPPSASLALAAAGYGPDSDEVNSIATSYLRNKSAPDLAPTGTPIRAGELEATPENLENAGLLAKSAYEKFGVLYDTNARQAFSPSQRGEGGGGIVQGLKGAFVDNWDDPMSKVRGTVRAADTIGRTVPQMAQGRYRTIANSIEDRGLAQTFRDQFDPNRAVMGWAQAYEQTDLGQMQGALMSGDRVDVGRGWFNNDDKLIGINRRLAELQHGKIVYADGSVHARTIGRDMAGAMGIEPGSRGYSIVSGMGDLAVQLGSFKIGSNAAVHRQGERAFKSITAGAEDAGPLARMVESIGGIAAPGRRMTYDPAKARAWVAGAEGRKVTEWLTEARNTREIDRLTGGRWSTDLIRDLADSDSMERTARILTEALDTSSNAKKIRAVGAGEARVVAPWRQTGIAISDNVPRIVNRMFSIVPERAIDLTDSRKAADQLERYAATMKLSPEARDELFDRMIRVDDKARFAGDAGDKYNAMAAKQLARSERREVLIDALRAGKADWMDRYAKFARVVEEGAEVHGAKQFGKARERLQRAEAIIDDVLNFSKSHDAEVNYWYDEANASRGFFSAIIDVVDETPGQALTKAEKAAAKDVAVEAAVRQVKVLHQDPRISPTLIAEHAGDTMYMPGRTELREAFNSPLISALSKVPGVKPTKQALEFYMDKVWKPSHLLRLAFPVRVIGDEQARVLATGGDSLFNHPIAAIAWMLGDSQFGRVAGRGVSDARGAAFDRRDAWAGALNRSNENDLLWRDVEVKRREHFAPVRYGQPKFFEAWQNNLGQLMSDPVARLIVDSANLDDAKRVWWENMADTRQRLAASHTSKNPRKRSGEVLLSRSGADEYVDEIAERLGHITQNDPRLVNALRTGKLQIPESDETIAAGLKSRVVDGERVVDVPMFVGEGQWNKDFELALGDYFDDVAVAGFRDKNRVLVGRAASQTEEQIKAGDRVITKLFATLMGRPDDFLSRSPYARQQYWAEVRSRVALLHPDDVSKLVANAEKAKLPRAEIRTIKRLAGKGVDDVDDALTLDELHQLGVQRSVSDTQDLLYDLSRRHQISDMARLIAPFGEAWAEVLKVWGKTIADNPQGVARVSLGLRAARSEDAGAALAPGDGTYDPTTGETTQRGLFYPDPYGNEVFTFPLTGDTLGMLGMPPIQMQGKVAGLSIGASVMPGLGPVAQIPLAGLMSNIDDPKYDGLRELMFPYGEPRGGLAKQVTLDQFPSYLQKALNRNGGYDDHSHASMVADSWRYLASTGNYNVSGQGASEDEINRLLEDAKQSTKWMQTIRALGQFSAPTSPGYEWMIEDKSGKRVSAVVLGQELQSLYASEDPEVRDNAVLIFLERHGDGAFGLLQGKTVSTSPAGGLPPTVQARKWLAGNKDLQQKYSASYGLFAPRSEDEEFDINLYWDLVESGEREQVDPKVAIHLANEKVARAIYNSARTKITAAQREADPSRVSLTAEQSRALYELRQELEERYPGYSADGERVQGSTNPATRDQVIRELERAVEDPKLADNPLTEPLALYLDTRRQVADAIEAQGGTDTAWTKNKDYAHVRQAMYRLGTQLASESVEFQSAWESLLFNEFDRAMADDEARRLN